MNEAWTWRPLGEMFEIGAGKTMSAAARNGADKTPSVLQRLRGLAYHDE